ncbi:hypothetical protein DEIPH_ctg016orf0003 [Deinococcus phoenicis]|uniref:Uncharacterized protein n=1 Tax=Deinococcus phoenicis TaxID=1476583 RepID=A0A016QSS9_9DEIO|nr:hypothetical protein [Deinococcus phoenicis]EYB68859.1 hypothetical protein DEIPH_ctg016orf0003 [Deinococcus phoenicis]
MPSLGAPPTYSTPATLGLALLALITSLWHGTLGALDYAQAGRYEGLALILAAALMLVYGVLTLIRYAEARDAMTDPHPRTPMYDTPHQGRVPRIGVGLALLLGVGDVAFALGAQHPLGHLAGLGLVLLVARQALKIRPEPDRDAD